MNVGQRRDGFVPTFIPADGDGRCNRVLGFTFGRGIAIGVLRSHLSPEGKEHQPRVGNSGRGASKWAQTIGKRMAF